MAPGGGALIGQPEGVHGLEKWLGLPKKKLVLSANFALQN